MTTFGRTARFGAAALVAVAATLGTGGIALADDNPPPSVPCMNNGTTCKAPKGPIASQALCQAEFFGVYAPQTQTAAGYACVQYPENSGTWYLYTNRGQGHVPPGPGAR
jgi:hypothetical protein